MASANMFLYYFTKKINTPGSPKWDCAVGIIESYAPMFDLMARVAESLGGRIPTDEEFMAFPDFHDMQWHPDTQQALVPLNPRDDILYLENKKIVFSTLSRPTIVDFRRYLAFPDDHPLNSEDLLGYKKQAEGETYYLADHLCHYYQAASEGERYLHLVAERRTACLPMLSYMKTSGLFHDKALVYPTMKFNEWNSCPMAPLSIFPVKHTESSWVQSTLPDHSMAVVDLLLSISQTPCLVPSTECDRGKQAKEYEAVVSILHAILFALDKQELPVSTGSLFQGSSSTQLTRKLYGCLLLGTFDCLIAG
jgi:hypothetical protein